MSKQVSVTFEWDPTTETVSNLTCFVDGIEKKNKTTRSPKKKEDEVLADENIIVLEENKLVFNNRSVATMGLEWKDRVVIKYEKLKDAPKGSKPFPIVGKDISFDEEGSGNQVTKANTVSYRGKANTILKEYGSEFSLEPYVTKSYPDGVWKLVSKAGGNEDLTYEDTVEKAEDIDITVLTDEGHNTDDKIDEMTFKL
jgi:hypothetical protein